MRDMKIFCKETFLKYLDVIKSLDLLKHNIVNEIFNEFDKKCTIQNTFKKREN